MKNVVKKISVSLLATLLALLTVMAQPAALFDGIATLVSAEEGTQNT